MARPINRGIARQYLERVQEWTTKGRIQRALNISEGRTAPALDAIAIGSGRRVTAAILFFDIRGFTTLTSSEDSATLSRVLVLLNCVIPAMMRVLYRHSAYVEKNTGDGLMGVLGVETSNETTAKNALSAASEMMYVLHSIVNPQLIKIGIDPVDARIGVDMGQLILARIGVPRGSADDVRSSVTAVGPAANRASKLQGMASTNEIWCGDTVRRWAPCDQQALFDDVTPPDWQWIYGNRPDAPYRCWRYLGRTADPLLLVRRT